MKASLLFFNFLLCLATFNSIAETDPFPKVDKMHKELNGSCNYPILDKYKSDTKFNCQLNVIKKRCNKIDDCYVYCYSNDVGEGIGGGCAHLCNYALKNEWNPPSEISRCEKAK